MAKDFVGGKSGIRERTKCKAAKSLRLWWLLARWLDLLLPAGAVAR